MTKALFHSMILASKEGVIMDDIKYTLNTKDLNSYMIKNVFGGWLNHSVVSACDRNNSLRILKADYKYPRRYIADNKHVDIVVDNRCRVVEAKFPEYELGFEKDKFGNYFIIYVNSHEVDDLIYRDFVTEINFNTRPLTEKESEEIKVRLDRRLKILNWTDFGMNLPTTGMEGVISLQAINWKTHKPVIIKHQLGEDVMTVFSFYLNEANYNRRFVNFLQGLAQEKVFIDGKDIDEMSIPEKCPYDPYVRRTIDKIAKNWRESKGLDKNQKDAVIKK